MPTLKAAHWPRLVIAASLFVIGGCLACCLAWYSMVAYSLAGVFGLNNLKYLDARSALEIGVLFSIAVMLASIGQRSLRHRTSYATTIWMFLPFSLAFAYYCFWFVFAGSREHIIQPLEAGTALTLVSGGLGLWGWQRWQAEGAGTRRRPEGE